MNILIVGCGYVGKALIPTLQSIAPNISVTTRQTDRVAELRKMASAVHVISSASDITKLVFEHDVVIFSVGADSRDSYEQAYLANAEAIVAGLEQSNKKQQVIYTSSTSVYGDHGGEWVDETSELKPMTKQAEILVKTEEALLDTTSSDKNICIFRLGGIIGPGRSIEEKVIRNAGETFPGDGMSYTNLSPLEEIVDGIGYAIENQIEGVFNLCIEEHLPRKDLYDNICRDRNLPFIKWDSNKISIHGGNKRVSSKKLQTLWQ